MSRLISKSVGNSSAIYTSDTHNISNTNNQIIFNKMMSGIIETPSLSYLMNYQVMRLNDVKSVLEYNYGNISLMLAENAQMEEIFDEFTVICRTGRRSRRNRAAGSRTADTTNRADIAAAD